MNTIFLTKSNSQKTVGAMIEVLRNDGLIISPSDTVYGLIVNAMNEKAVKKLIAFKNRPFGKPISVFVSDFKMMADYVEIDTKQSAIIHELLPGPFTIILKSKHKISSLLESEKGSLGARIPNYPLITNLVKIFGQPITATSANISGRPPHYQISTLIDELPKSKRSLVDLVIDNGVLPRNKPSTVIDLASPDLKIIRQGDIAFKNRQIYISYSALKTQKIGQYLLQKNLPKSKDRPLIFIIQGELGVGKTQMVKGMGQAMGIENIISPSYVIYYEYGNFYHFDLYNIQEAEEFKYLGIGKVLKPGNILVFEWGEKSGEIIDLLKERGKVVFVEIRYIDDTEREVSVQI